MSPNPIYHSFLEEQLRAARSFDACALVQVTPIHLTDGPPAHFAVTFSCKGLVREASGDIQEATRFRLGIFFGPDHLHHVDPFSTLTWLGPENAWHPQIASPFVCLGRLYAGMGLTEIVLQAHQVITYAKVTMKENDCLNPVACAWAREALAQGRFPLDTRPLSGRKLELRVEAVPAGAPSHGGPGA